MRRRHEQGTYRSVTKSLAAACAPICFSSRHSTRGEESQDQQGRLQSGDRTYLKILVCIFWLTTILCNNIPSKRPALRNQVHGPSLGKSSLPPCMYISDSGPSPAQVSSSFSRTRPRVGRERRNRNPSYLPSSNLYSTVVLLCCAKEQRQNLNMGAKNTESRILQKKMWPLAYYLD
jgi:hypothetical protein